MSEDMTVRVTRIEERQNGLKRRINVFEKNCTSNVKEFRDAAKETNDRIDKFVNDEVHRLEAKIKDAEKVRRQPWGAKEWGAIVITAITSASSIIIAVIQFIG